MSFSLLAEGREYTWTVQGLFNEFLVYANQIKDNIKHKCDILRNSTEAVGTSYTCPLTRTGRRGRPRYTVQKSQIEFLREKRFCWVRIAKLLNISIRTLQRHREQLGITDEPYTNISDGDLTQVMQEVRLTTPNVGQMCMVGALRSCGMHVQRFRVHQILRIDPLGTVLRWNQAVYRRRYSVPYPNALWHIDGNHKLISWRMVIHACIDGYSRLIVYLHCSNNNLAATVKEQFLVGVQKWGFHLR